MSISRSKFCKDNGWVQFVVFEKCTIAYLYQIAWEIMLLLIINLHEKKITKSQDRCVSWIIVYMCGWKWVYSHVTWVQRCNMSAITNSAYCQNLSVFTFCEDFSCTSLTSNNMISSSDWCNKNLVIFQRLQIALALQACAILLYLNNLLVLITTKLQWKSFYYLH